MDLENGVSMCVMNEMACIDNELNERGCGSHATQHPALCTRGVNPLSHGTEKVVTEDDISSAIKKVMSHAIVLKVYVFFCGMENSIYIGQ